MQWVIIIFFGDVAEKVLVKNEDNATNLLRSQVQDHFWQDCAEIIWLNAVCVENICDPVNGFWCNAEQISGPEEFAHYLGFAFQCVQLIFVYFLCWNYFGIGQICISKIELLPGCDVNHGVTDLVFVLFAFGLELLDGFRLLDNFEFEDLGEIAKVVNRFGLHVDFHCYSVTCSFQVLK